MNRLFYTDKLTYRNNVCICDPKKVEKFIRFHGGMYDDVVRAADNIYKEFGKNIQLELRIKKIWETGPEHLLLITRLPIYDDTIMDRLDVISDLLGLDDADHGGWLILTTDFKIYTSVNNFEVI